MIHIGLDSDEARRAVEAYCAHHPVKKVVVLCAERFAPTWTLPVPHEVVTWPNIIRYVVFYRLVAEIDADTLVVVFECLRTQERHDLTFNCVRHYLSKTPHRLVFQRVPILDAVDDLMIPVDFVTDSRWKGLGVSPEILRAVQWEVRPVALSFAQVDVPTTPAERDAYAREKRARIDGLGAGDPHTIPRNLLLLGGRAKARWVAAQGAADARRYLGRNGRLGLPRFDTFDTATPGAPYTVVELCHRFGELADVIATTGQHSFDVLVTDLKVDHWYLDRFRGWAGRVADAYAAIRG